MPSPTDNVSSALGKYMLSGWVLTDENHDCGVPLMRSKDKKIKFCVVCDGSPDTVSKKSSPLADAQPRHLPTPSAEPSTDEELELRDDEADYMSPIPSQESTARRQQSDKASQLIGQKLLAGWIILEDTCPNSSCYGVPLVKSPRDKSKFCVICERSYLQQSGASGDVPIPTQAKVINLEKKLEPSAGSNSGSNSRDVSAMVDRSSSEGRIRKKARNQSIVSEDGSEGIATSISRSLNSLGQKLDDLTSNLEKSSDPTHARELMQAITACADAIAALKNAA